VGFWLTREVAAQASHINLYQAAVRLTILRGTTMMTSQARGSSQVLHGLLTGTYPLVTQTLCAGCWTLVVVRQRTETDSHTPTRAPLPLPIDRCNTGGQGGTTQTLLVTRQRAGGAWPTMTQTLVTVVTLRCIATGEKTWPQYEKEAT
jgi:hypothetical protein